MYETLYAGAAAYQRLEENRRYVAERQAVRALPQKARPAANTARTLWARLSEAWRDAVARFDLATS